MGATIDELVIADAAASWSELGFAVDGDICVFGDVRIRFAGADAGKGLTGWSLRDIATTELDGLVTARSERPPPDESPAHPNGVGALDHVVAITPALERTVAALQSAGLDLRRIREEPTPAGAPRQAFFRLGATILEVVQEPQEAIERARPPRLLLGPRLPRSRHRRHRRWAGRKRQRGACRGSARPPHRHAASRGGPRGAGGADHPAGSRPVT